MLISKTCDATSRLPGFRSEERVTVERVGI